MVILGRGRFLMSEVQGLLANYSQIRTRVSESLAVCPQKLNVHRISLAVCVRKIRYADNPLTVVLNPLRSTLENPHCVLQLCVLNRACPAFLAPRRHPPPTPPPPRHPPLFTALGFRCRVHEHLALRVRTRVDIALSFEDVVHRGL
jgi:hypothetical protein